MAPPKGWPADLPYLDTPSYSAFLTQEQRNSILVSTADLNFGTLEGVGKRSKTRICVIDDAGHPAYGQRGLFAAEHLKPNAFVLPYIGFVHSQQDIDETSDYDLSLDRDQGLGVDAVRMGNEARFVNDYRGIPARQGQGPNAEFRDCWIRVKNTYAKVIGIYALPAGKSRKRVGGIAKGEEIVVSYGKGFWRGRELEELA